MNFREMGCADVKCVPWTVNTGWCKVALCFGRQLLSLWPNERTSWTFRSWSWCDIGGFLSGVTEQ